MIRSIVGGSLVLPGILRELLAGEPVAGSAGDKPGTPGSIDQSTGALSPGNTSDRSPLTERPPHFAPRARRVIFLFMQGGVSHLDTFDYKPQLARDHGQAIEYRREGKQTPLVGPQWKFRPRGESGTYVSDIFPHIAGRADDLCLVRSMYTNIGDHYQDTLGIHTGSWSVARPSLGAWLSYGLGTFNENLPAYMVIAPHLPYAGGQLWASDFLPGEHQGTRVVPGGEPVPNVRSPLDGEQQARELSLVRAFNRRHRSGREHDPTLAARIQSFETAYRMQTAAPEAFDLSSETAGTLANYGLSAGNATGFGWQCLVARRLAERGVRFIELIDTGASNNWDAHGDMQNHVPLAANVDRPIAALLADLRARGLWDDTLVVWTTEFGRTPNRDDTAAEGATGRGHQATAYSTWLAGGGVRGGHVHGQTDDYGKHPISDPVHVHDLHATILHLLGIDHERLTYRHAGRDFRLTDVHGTVVRGILA